MEAYIDVGHFQHRGRSTASIPVKPNEPDPDAQTAFVFVALCKMIRDWIEVGFILTIGLAVIAGSIWVGDTDGIRC